MLADEKAKEIYDSYYRLFSMIDNPYDRRCAAEAAALETVASMQLYCSAVFLPYFVAVEKSLNHLNNYHAF